MTSVARLLIPAIRWDPETGFRGERPSLERALAAGVGGFIIFGGESTAVAELTLELRSRSAHDLLIAADLERGAGQQFAGCTGLPPLAAVGASGDAGDVRNAARLTATEALELGVNWVVAPVCDVDLEQNNPIVGTRAAHTDPRVVAQLVAEWIDACQSAGAMACAKHFPGHGRTSTDSHAGLPEVSAVRAELDATDLLPFRAAIDAGVASVMTAHVAFPALDESARPATLSRAIAHDLLRGELGFDGLVVTDAMIMEGVLAGRREEEAVVSALAAGCDLVVYPVDVRNCVKAVEDALAAGRLDEEALRDSEGRRLRWARWTAAAPRAGQAPEPAWAREFSQRAVHDVRGRLEAISQLLDVIILDDDLGGPYPAPSREPFMQSLRAGGFDARRVEVPSLDGRRSTLVALFGDIRSWKGRPGYGKATLSALSRIIDRDPDTVVIQFSAPRLAEELPSAARRVLCAWGGERAMQEAAAGRLSQLLG